MFVTVFSFTCAPQLTIFCTLCHSWSNIMILRSVSLFYRHQPFTVVVVALVLFLLSMSDEFALVGVLCLLRYVLQVTIFVRAFWSFATFYYCWICDYVQHIFWKMLFNKLEQVRDVVCIYVEYKDEWFYGICNIKYINRGIIVSIKSSMVRIRLRIISEWNQNYVVKLNEKI